MRNGGEWLGCWDYILCCGFSVVVFGVCEEIKWVERGIV